MSNTLTLYGHPFSSYSWKPLIALHAAGLDHDFQILDPRDSGSPPNAFIASHGGPLGKFPVLVDGERTIFESTSIIEYLTLHFPQAAALIPTDPDAALAVRTLDRVLDLYVMNQMQAVVAKYLRDRD